MAFDIMSLQKGRGPVQARSKADEGRAVLKYIDVDDLVPSEDNFYSMTAIEELAALIELSGGVKQPALVVPLGGGKYKIIAGHRRRLASLQLVKQGKEAYRKMPCMVEDSAADKDADGDELRAIDEAILLITTNGQREKTDWDKVQEATRLRALLERKRRFEKITGETRKLIAEQLGTTPAQVGRYDSIEKHLHPLYKSWLQGGHIGISVAYELSTLPEDVQKESVEACWWPRGKDITLEDVRKRKQAAENVPPPAPPSEQSTRITMVTVDVGPVPTPEQMQKILERAKERGSGGAVVLPAKPEDEVGAPKIDWQKYTGENAGEIADSPAPPAEPEPMGRTEAVMLLESLQEYCEIMTDSENEEPETWEKYTEALFVAISALRGR